MNPTQQRLYNDQLTWATNVIALAKANLIRGKKVASGSLYNSVSFQIDKKGRVTFLADQSATFVESGRRPGKFPPPQAIAKWAKVKGLPQFRDKKGRYISNDSRAFLLARAIAKKGIRPFPFYTDAVEQSITQLAKTQADIIGDSIARSLEI